LIKDNLNWVDYDFTYSLSVEIHILGGVQIGD